MITFSKTGIKPNYLFNLLPHYFKRGDSYKPNSVGGYEEDGFVERYLEALSNDLDNNLSPYLDSIGYLYDALSLSSLPHSDSDKFLVHLSDMLGNPPDISDTQKYKVLLSHLVDIIKVKGTPLAISKYLSIFGYAISDITYTPYTSPLYDNLPTKDPYDNSTFYDMGSIFYFDMELTISDYPGTITGDPGATWLNLLRDALGNFILPININLLNITYV